MTSETKPTTSSKQQAATQTSAGDQVFTFWQATVLIPSTVLGVSLLTLPRHIAQATEGSGLVVMLVSGLFSLAVVWMLTKLGQRFPGLTYVGYTQKMLTFKGNRRLGRWLALPFMLSVTLWWLLTVAFHLRAFGESQRSIVFTHTPIWFMVGTMLVVSAFVASNKAEIIARLNEFLFPIVIIPMLLIGIMTLGDAEWTNLLPLFHMTWQQFWSGVLQGIYAFEGVSVILIFMAAYQRPDQAVKAHSIGVGVIIATYFFAMIGGMAMFSHEDVTQMTWPTLEIVKNIRLPASFFERIESGFLAIWVVAVFTTMANFLASMVHLISEYIGIKEHQRVWITLPLVIIIFVLALWPNSVFETFRYVENVQFYGFILSLIIPPLLLAMAMVRRMGNGGRQEKQSQKNEGR